MDCDKKKIMKLESMNTFPSELHRIIKLFKVSFSQMGSKVSRAEVEALSICIFEVMSSRWRTYHVPSQVMKKNRKRFKAPSIFAH